MLVILFVLFLVWLLLLICVIAHPLVGPENRLKVGAHWELVYGCVSNQDSVLLKAAQIYFYFFLKFKKSNNKK